MMILQTARRRRCCLLRISFFASIMLVLTACNTLPDGMPPDSPEIVDIAVKKTYSVAGAANLLSTSLIAGSIGVLSPSSRVKLQTDAGMPFREYAFEVMSAARRTVGFQISSSTPDYLLEAFFTPLKDGIFEWEMSLSGSGVVLWRQGVIVDSKISD